MRCGEGSRGKRDRRGSRQRLVARKSPGNINERPLLRGILERQ